MEAHNNNKIHHLLNLMHHLQLIYQLYRKFFHYKYHNLLLNHFLRFN